MGKISLKTVGDAKDCREAQPRPVHSGSKMIKYFPGLFGFVRTELAIIAQNLEML